MKTPTTEQFGELRPVLSILGEDQVVQGPFESTIRFACPHVDFMPSSTQVSQKVHKSVYAT